MRRICKVLLKESKKKENRNINHKVKWGNGGLSDVILV